MPDLYSSSRTGMLIVDPYNDFLSDGGKLWPLVKPVAESVDLLTHLRALLEAARRTGIFVFYVPHRRSREADFDGWRHPTPWQITIDRAMLFADSTWGADWHPDLVPLPGEVIVQEHWGQNGFFNSDLDLQLKQRGLKNIVVVGMAANLCVEATARFGAELGYHVTLVRDATAALSHDAMKAAHEVTGPTFAHAIVTTDELIAALGKT